MSEIYKNYGYTPDREAIDRSLEIIASNLENVISETVLKDCFSFMDLTSLHNADTVASITKLMEKVNSYRETYPEFPLPASVCVYPNLVNVVAESRKDKELHATAVAGCFPTSQSFIEIKTRECELAVEAGADEIDIVLNVGAFLDGDYESVCDEITEQKHSAGDSILKVILETGALKSAQAIRDASVLSLYSDADFLKTSTGKEYPGATLEAAYVMAQCIKEYYEKTGRKVGFKASGGIRSTADALGYYAVVRDVLGEEWLCHDLFRIGASSLANALLSSMEGEEVKYF